MAVDWGTVTVGRISLRETFSVAESGGSTPTLALEGQEASPDLSRAELYATHENILALETGKLVPVTFSDKPERDGYYTVTSNSASVTEYAGDLVLCDWKIGLNRVGSENETDLQSRLTGAIRANDFSLTGEKTHAPALGHYGYFTGATSPSSMTRTGLDGSLTVYRNVPVGVSPRWGATAADALSGRVLVTSNGYELEGCSHSMAQDDWTLSNGLVNVTPSSSAGVLDVASFSGGAYRSKLWRVTVGGVAPAWDSASILRNDLELCRVRLTASRSPGRVVLDVTLRRGSRLLEGYLQSGTSSTLAVALVTPEDNSNTAASGYLTASGDDADGNQFVCGSARTFTGSTDGSMTKSASTFLDFFLGVVASQTTLNANPTFETDTSDWSATNASLARSNVQAKHGSWSGLLTSTAGSSPRAESGQSAVTAGASYRASGWLFAPSAIAGGCEVNINWYDASHGYLSSAVNFAVPTVGAWRYYDKATAAPVNTAFANISFVISGTPGAGVLVYGDGLRLRAATPSGDSATDLRNQYLGFMAEQTYPAKR